jgi:hypothetical protein
VQEHDARVDRIVQRLRVGDLSVVAVSLKKGRLPGYAGACADRLLLAAVFRAFPG